MGIWDSRCRAGCYKHFSRLICAIDQLNLMMACNTILWWCRPGVWYLDWCWIACRGVHLPPELGCAVPRVMATGVPYLGLSSYHELLSWAGGLNGKSFLLAGGLDCFTRALSCFGGLTIKNFYPVQVDMMWGVQYLLHWACNTQIDGVQYRFDLCGRAIPLNLV